MSVCNTVGSQWMTVVVANTAYTLFFLVRTHPRIFKTGRQGPWAGATFVYNQSCPEAQTFPENQASRSSVSPNPQDICRDFEGHRTIDTAQRPALLSAAIHQIHFKSCHHVSTRSWTSHLTSFDFSFFVSEMGRTGVAHTVSDLPSSSADVL